MTVTAMRPVAGLSKDPLFIVAPVDELGGDTFRAVGADLAGLGVEHVDAIELDPHLVIVGSLDVDIRFAENDEQVARADIGQLVSSMLLVLGGMPGYNFSRKKPPEPCPGLAPLLAAKDWRDSEFAPSQRAFHYMRVLEIPAPPWSPYDAKFFSVKRPGDLPASIRERAYIWPIWYTPDGANSSR